MDLVAHSMKSDEKEQEKMNVSYAAAYCKITNASAETHAKACELVQRIIKTSL